MAKKNTLYMNSCNFYPFGKSRSVRFTKKGDMPFWLVIMIVSLIFGVIVIVISSGAVKDYLKSVTGIKLHTTANEACFVAPNAPVSVDKDNDGLADDKTYTDASGKEQKCDPD